MEPIGRDARILSGQPQNLPSLALDRKPSGHGMKITKRLGLEFEEEGGHKDWQRVQPKGGREGTRKGFSCL